MCSGKELDQVACAQELMQCPKRHLARARAIARDLVCFSVKPDRDFRGKFLEPLGSLGSCVSLRQGGSLGNHSRIEILHFRPW